MATVPLGKQWTLAESTGETLSGIAFDPIIGFWAVAGGSSSPRLLTARDIDVVAGTPGFSLQTLTGTNKIRGLASDEAVSGPSGEFATVGDAGETHNSVNGSSWSLGTPITGTPIMTALAFGGTTVGLRAIAVGVGEIARQIAADSPSFSNLASPTQTMRAIVAKPGTNVWTSVGDLTGDGYVITSADGNVFAAAYLLATGRRFLSIDFSGGGGFIICSTPLASGNFTPLIASSATGLTGSWTTQEGAANDVLQAVKFLAGQIWVIGGSAGQIYHSPDDGTTWNQLVSPITGSIVGFAYDSANGIAGLVTTSGEFWTSKEITQSDPPTPVTPPAVTEPITTNPDVSGTAINRLISQFRG